MEFSWGSLITGSYTSCAPSSMFSFPPFFFLFLSFFLSPNCQDYEPPFSHFPFQALGLNLNPCRPRKRPTFRSSPTATTTRTNPSSHLSGCHHRLHLRLLTCASNLNSSTPTIASARFTAKIKTKTRRAKKKCPLRLRINADVRMWYNWSSRWMITAFKVLQCHHRITNSLSPSQNPNTNTTYVSYHRRALSVPLPNEWFASYPSTNIALPLIPNFESRPASPVHSISRYTQANQAFDNLSNPF